MNCYCCSTEGRLFADCDECALFALVSLLAAGVDTDFVQFAQQKMHARLVLCNGGAGTHSPMYEEEGECETDCVYS